MNSPTLLIAMPDGFDLNLSRASQTIRMGYYHGALQAGWGAKLVGYSNLFEVICKAPSPVVWLTYDDYRFLGDDTLMALREEHHIVSVNCWFDGMEQHCTYSAIPSAVLPEHQRRAILDSTPDFVWCSAPESYIRFYAGWADAGMKVVSLPWACDTERYHPVIGDTFADVEMAFVGGYRGYKEEQYAERLWPYESRLKVWGYSAWPRCYQGYLPNDQEAALYAQARLCPTISEPHFALTGDTVERPFKIMGSGGVTILDLPCYRELFLPGEVLIATHPDDYRTVVKVLLEDDEVRAIYREKGYQAVLRQHTYRHRVETIERHLK